MIRRVFIVIGISLLLLLTTQLGHQGWMRIIAEKNVINPVRIFFEHLLIGDVSQKNTETLTIQNYTEKIAQLERENSILRKQLGASPEQGRMFPAQVLWTTTSELIVNFPYSQTGVPNKSFVVLDSVFIGTVARSEGQTLVIYKATHSLFSQEAKSDKGAQGKVSGSFNEGVRFETNIDAALSKGDRIYAVDKVSGGVFLVGFVKQVILNERLPIKTAILDYRADTALLETVFVLL